MKENKIGFIKEDMAGPDKNPMEKGWGYIMNGKEIIREGNLKYVINNEYIFDFYGEDIFPEVSNVPVERIIMEGELRIPRVHGFYFNSTTKENIENRLVKINQFYERDFLEDRDKRDTLIKKLYPEKKSNHLDIMRGKDNSKKPTN